MHYSSEVARIDVAAGRKPRARGILLADGRRLQADATVSNGDYAATYGLIDNAHRFERKVLGDEPLQYFHVPTLTDPSLAPPPHDEEAYSEEDPRIPA